MWQCRVRLMMCTVVLALEGRSSMSTRPLKTCVYHILSSSFKHQSSRRLKEPKNVWELSLQAWNILKPGHLSFQQPYLWKWKPFTCDYYNAMQYLLTLHFPQQSSTPSRERHMPPAINNSHAHILHHVCQAFPVCPKVRRQHIQKTGKQVQLRCLHISVSRFMHL